MSDGRKWRPDDGPRSDGNTEETVRYPATLRPPGVREGDLVPPHVTTAPTPVPEPPTRGHKTKLGLGGVAPGGTFSGSGSRGGSAPPAPDAVTRVQAAPTAPRSAFAKSPSAPPPAEPDGSTDEDERMMNSLGLVEPWLAPEPERAGPFEQTPSTRPPPRREDGQQARREPSRPTPEPAPPARERSLKSTQVGLGPNKPPPPTGRASAAPRAPARPTTPQPQPRQPPPRAEPPRPSAPTRAAPTPQPGPVSRSPDPPAAPSRAHGVFSPPSRAPAPPPPQPERAISRPLPPLQSAPAAPRPAPAPRAADAIRLALDERDVQPGAVRTSQRPAGVPGRSRAPLTLGVGAVAVAVGVLGWIALSGGKPATAPPPAAPPPAAALAPVEPTAAPPPAVAPTPVIEPTAPVAAPEPPPAAAPAAPTPAAAAPSAPPVASRKPAHAAARTPTPSEPSAPPPTGEKRDSILQARDALRALSEGRRAPTSPAGPVLTIEPAAPRADAPAGDDAPYADPPPARDEPAPEQPDAPVLKLEPAPEPAPPADEPPPAPAE